MYRQLQRQLLFRNRKGRQGGARSYRHAYTLAKLSIARDRRLPIRAALKHWDEHSVTAWLKLVPIKAASH